MASRNLIENNKKKKMKNKTASRKDNRPVKTS
jgi:hypothetical protein